MKQLLAMAQRQQRVLIVDDEAVNRRLLELLLASDGLTLMTASGGEQALAIVSAQAPDLILLDAMMPGLSGFDVAARIKGSVETKNIPIIMITALDDKNSRMRALNVGVEDFLTKPVDRVELSARVKNLLRLKAYGDFFEVYSTKLEGEVLDRTVDLLDRTRVLEEHAAALRRNEARTNYALGAARMGVWEMEAVSRAITWSDTMGALFGLPPDSTPAHESDLLALIHPDDHQTMRAAIAGALDNDAPFDVEYRAVWPDGTEHWSASRASVLRDNTGGATGLRGVTMDISDRRSLEEQFRQAQKMEAVGQLAGGVAHDFNNLLTAILGYAELVVETLAPDDDRRADMNEIVVASHRAVVLTRQLLAFSRKQVVQPVTLDLNALVGGMRHMLSRLIGESVELVAVLDPDLGAVRADAGQLEQVLMNLVVNARDAMLHGGRVAIKTSNVTLDGAIAGDTTIRSGPHVMLSVSDSGEGMTEEVKRHLFEPFFTTKDQGKGTGLGLATVYGIIKQSGGHIRVYSEPGNGSVFKVYLPRVAPDTRAEVEAALEPVHGGTETILLVEDDEAVRALGITILARAGYRVVAADRPDSAAALWSEHSASIDLLVTDVVMPGSSGPALHETLCRDRPTLPVLYLSGFTDDMLVHEGRITAGVDLLQKPFTTDSLLRRVRASLDHAVEAGAT
jgi:two-component system cell cycle sensor histidine kinase/response regulator CckA